MDKKYKIIDERPIELFKKVTFSGFKKTDVINSVFKSIESNKVEAACHWVTECIISGYTVQLWEKLINFSCKIIHRNNPRLPLYLYKKNLIFNNQLALLKKSSVLLLRNSQMIRNLFFDVISTVCSSSKKIRYDLFKKLNEEEDFKYENIQKQLCSQMNILPDHLIHFTDPSELRVFLNEIYTMCKNKQFGYEKCCYWVQWLLKWESLHKKKGNPWNISERKVQGVDKKYCTNIIWAFWEIIFEELKGRNDPKLDQQVKCLYTLFRYNYTQGKRNNRLPLLYFAFGYLTYDISFNVPIRNDYKLFIQVQSNVNKMFTAKKVHEKNNEIVVPKLSNKQLKALNFNVEIIENKIDEFNMVDAMFTKQ